MKVRPVAVLSGGLDVETVAREALLAQSELIAAAARHATGSAVTLVGVENEVVIASRSTALLRRESGTIGRPPRPALRGVGVLHAASAASAVGHAVAEVVRGA